MFVIFWSASSITKLHHPTGTPKTRMVLIAFATALPGIRRCVVFVACLPSVHRTRNHPLVLKTDYLIGCRSITTFSLWFIPLSQWGSSQSLSGIYFSPTCLIIFVLTHVADPRSQALPGKSGGHRPFCWWAFYSTPMFSLPWHFPYPWIRRSLSRFLAGHLLAVAASGLFAAAFVLALQGVLLSVLGERLFRRLSLVLAGSVDHSSVDAAVALSYAF